VRRLHPPGLRRIYAWLPLGQRVLRRIENIVREEMDSAGAQEVLLPIVQRSSSGPAAVARRSTAAHVRLLDRKETAYCLAPTAEEVITTIVLGRVRQLPRPAGQPVPDRLEVPRRAAPRFGLLRTREFS